jgi:hypothetical protein
MEPSCGVIIGLSVLLIVTYNILTADSVRAARAAVTVSECGDYAEVTVSEPGELGHFGHIDSALKKQG